MVGPYGGWIKYSYEEPLFLVPESDGVRVIANSKCEFISRVPDVTESIFKIGSTSPAATLYDAYDNFEVLFLFLFLFSFLSLFLYATHSFFVALLLFNDNFFGRKKAPKQMKTFGR